MKSYEIHPEANEMPLLEGAAYEEFKKDIERNGIQHPILLLDGKIVDGRNRYRVCTELGIEPKVKNVKLGKRKMRELVASENYFRRHLSVGQRGLFGSKISKTILEKASLEKDQKADSEKKAENGKPKEKKPNVPSVKDAAALVNVSPRTISNSRTIEKSGSSALVECVKADKIPISVAANLALAPKAEQNKALAGKQDIKDTIDRYKKKAASKANKRKGSKKKKKTTGQIDTIIEQSYAVILRSVDDRARAMGGQGQNHKTCLAALKSFFGKWEAWKTANTK